MNLQTELRRIARKARRYSTRNKHLTGPARYIKDNGRPGHVLRPNLGEVA